MLLNCMTSRNRLLAEDARPEGGSLIVQQWKKRMIGGRNTNRRVKISGSDLALRCLRPPESAKKILTDCSGAADRATVHFHINVFWQLQHLTVSYEKPSATFCLATRNPCRWPWPLRVYKQGCTINTSLSVLLRKSVHARKRNTLLSFSLFKKRYTNLSHNIQVKHQRMDSTRPLKVLWVLTPKH